MLVQENQQVTRSWFTGILEGEGSLRNTASSNIEVRISNTNLDIIEACESYLKANSVWFNRRSQSRPPRKTEYTIEIRDSKYQIFKYAAILYELIKPSLECRNGEFQRILGTSETLCSPSVDLDWIAGIFEAEGSFDLRRNHLGVSVMRVEISNTNPKILAKVICNLDAMLCAYHVRIRRKTKEHHSQAWSIEIHGMKRCQRFLNAMNGRWIARRNKQRTSLMTEFINARFSHCYKDPYTQRELQIIQAVCDLNR